MCSVRRWSDGSIARRAKDPTDSSGVSTLVDSGLDPDVARLSPCRAPGVLDDEVLNARARDSISNSSNGVVLGLKARLSSDDARLVSLERQLTSINTYSNWLLSNGR